MGKCYQHIDLPPELEQFWKNFLVATEVEGTLFGIITFYKMNGQYFARSKSSLTGKRVKKEKRFQRTMHNAGLMALASKWITPVYNSLTEDWRCQDLQRKLVGIGVKLLHRGQSREAVQEAVWQELQRLGYRTEWPEWQLPPELEKWVKEEGESGAIGSALGSPEAGYDAAHANHEKLIQMWVNEKGELVFVEGTPKVDYLLDCDITSIVRECILRENEVARAP